MISMKDLAKECGVSVATVSKAINNHTDISESTRIRIKEMAKKLGYYPNSSARALKTNRSYNFGVLFVDQARNGLRHDYFSAVLDSFKVAAEECGYDITFINNNKKKNHMSYLEHTRYRGFDGVVVACVDFKDKEVLELIESDIPVVTIDYLFDGRSSVVSDNESGMKMLVEHVASKGHRKIAYIHGDDSSVTRVRLASFYKTMEELSLPVEDAYIKKGMYRNTETAAHQTKKLLEMKNPPTCIFYPDDYACLGGINAIKEKGLSVPEDVSVVGYDGIELSRTLSPTLTTLVQNAKEIGELAAQQLIAQVEKPKSCISDCKKVGGAVQVGESVQELKK